MYILCTYIERYSYIKCFSFLYLSLKRNHFHAEDINLQRKNDLDLCIIFFYIYMECIKSVGNIFHHVKAYGIFNRQRLFYLKVERWKLLHI